MAMKRQSNGAKNAVSAVDIKVHEWRQRSWTRKLLDGQNCENGSLWGYKWRENKNTPYEKASNIFLLIRKEKDKLNFKSLNQYRIFFFK